MISILQKALVLFIISLPQGCAVYNLFKSDKWAPSRPFDPKKGDKTSFLKEHYYPKKNIELINRQSVNQRIFDFSLEKESNQRKRIVDNFLDDYNKMLSIDTSHLEFVSNNKFDKIDKNNKESYINKVKSNKQYVKENLMIIQRLYEEENEIAFSSFLDEFFDPYYDIMNITNTKKQKILPEVDIDNISNYSGSTRDKLVKSRLAWYDIYGLSNTEEFKEE